jgi:small nuclear ribonucleoprotein (snRNP)-like protein
MSSRPDHLSLHEKSLPLVHPTPDELKELLPEAPTDAPLLEIATVDGRSFIGSLLAGDASGNLVLDNAREKRAVATTSGETEFFLGAVMIPGSQVSSSRRVEATASA